MLAIQFAARFASRYTWEIFHDYVIDDIGDLPGWCPDAFDRIDDHKIIALNEDVVDLVLQGKENT